MGLFDFIKNGKDNKTAKKTNSTLSETASAFKGDLATIQDTNGTVNPVDTRLNPSVQQDPSHNDDSEDSIVFMTFSKKSNATWRCPECGTISDGLYDGCVVCGFKR